MKLFQREQYSLFGGILDWMLTPLLLLWPVSLGLTWLVAQGLANQPYDRALEYDARLLARQVQQGQLPSGPEHPLRTGAKDTIHYQVLDPQGRLLAGQPALPRPPWTDAERRDGAVQLHDAELHGVDLRLAAVWVPLAGPDQPLALVQVAETRDQRNALAGEIIRGVMLPQFVVLPLAVMLVWMALARGITPLHRLEERIRARKPDDLSPLNFQEVPLEVAPLVNAVDDLLCRLNESLATQKRFLADAAHQLKTPLAGLRMQADLAQREGTSTQELKRSLQQIGHASMRASHTVNQLLALARVEGTGTALAKQRCDLARLVIDVVRDSVPRALERHVDLGYDGAEPGAPGVWMEGNPTLLTELVRNLVDNAINYMPSTPEQPGVVTVRLSADSRARTLLLQVEDTGPGVPEAERALVFQPFYRALGTPVDGSGLGLPIVQEIARQHGAQVTLEPARPGQMPPGARFSVRFAGLQVPPASS
ncbi:sensor histidine kinase [Comamonas endophytica]|uniref:histidine kinase n=1 Tax=Comamonas endophytica TaxID=2949090 RepID=A0ABY6G784_9BURK|nr:MULTISPECIES: sensor histidine kinase [unclassified Acidovorax]MCD2512298.1 sensor histidine kinase N-terminal domain-containing protein [Acidovorax sp. D4N7]UYG50245.1 sensor histidine kinase N-terminal domain-containing protein [Acidovorax sp. 5MLIR]